MVNNVSDGPGNQAATDGAPTPLASSPNSAPHDQSEPRSSESGGIDTGPSPFELEGWLEFNRRKWKVQPQRLVYPELDAEPPTVQAVVYLDRRGRIYHPPRNPYLPVRFRTTPTNFRYRQIRQWRQVGPMLVTDMRQRGVLNTLHLPPQITDVRPWQWAGFRVGVRYTFILDLPLPPNSVDSATARVWRKAEREGFRSERTTNMTDVATCLAGTEQRQGFQLGIAAADLALLAGLLGEDHFRAYLCYAPNGEPACAAVALWCPGAPAIGWVSGTRTEYLRTGSTQLLDYFHFADLASCGATQFDFCGANIPSIAAAKAGWGGRLVPYFTLEAYSTRRLARWVMNWWKFQFPGSTR